MIKFHDAIFDDAQAGKKTMTSHKKLSPERALEKLWEKFTRKFN